MEAPRKIKKATKDASDSDSEYEVHASSDSEPADGVVMDEMDVEAALLDPNGVPQAKKHRSKYDFLPPSNSTNPSNAGVYVDYSSLDDRVCGICAGLHPLGECPLIRLPSIITDARKAIQDPRNNEPPEYKVSCSNNIIFAHF